MTQDRKPLKVDGPAIIHQHLLKQIDINLFDFKEQLYRKTVHELFSVVKSLFYKKQNFRKTRNEIIEIISQNVYKECIDNCKFKGSIAAYLMAFCLKNKIIIPIYIFSKLR